MLISRGSLPAAAIASAVSLSLALPAIAGAQSPATVSPSVDRLPFWSQPDGGQLLADQALYLRVEPATCSAPTTAGMKISGPGLPVQTITSYPGCNFGDQPIRFQGAFTIGVSASNPLDRNDFNDLCAADNCSIISVEMAGKPKKTTSKTVRWSLSTNGTGVQSGSAKFTRSVKKRGKKFTYKTTVKLG